MKTHQQQWITASIERLKATIANWNEQDQREAWRHILIECGDTYSEVGQPKQTPANKPDIAQDDSLAFLGPSPGDIPF